MPPVEKAGHCHPHSAAARGAHIDADLEAALAIEAQTHAIERHVQRRDRARAVQHPHAIMMFRVGPGLLAAGPEGRTSLDDRFVAPREVRSGAPRPVIIVFCMTLFPHPPSACSRV
jgi:hypothetical protein